MANAAGVAPLDFPVASQYSTRHSFQITPTTLAASSLTTPTPVQIPAVGYLNGILLEVTIDGTGGTTPAWVGDAPWSVIESVTLRNAAGVNLIAPVTGFQLFTMGLYGGQTHFGPAADTRNGLHAPGAYSASTNFFVWLPVGMDISEAYGVIPALQSNASYQVAFTFAAQSSVTTSNPTLTVSVDATAHYFDVPLEMTANGVPQESMPPGMPAQVFWQIEQPSVAPGTQLIQSNNVGNLIRTVVFTLRNSSGARTDADWPALFEVYLNNQPRFSFRKSEFEFMMERWYGALAGSTKSLVTPNSLIPGVFALPYHALLGSYAGDPANTRAQILPTLTSSLVQYRAQDWGASASRLEIMTQVVSTTNAAYLFSK